MATKRSSLGEMIKGRVREFVREPSALFFVVLMPVLWMAILGFAFSGSGQRTYGVGWTKTEGINTGDKSEMVYNVMSKSSRVRFHEGTSDEMDTLLRRGEVEVIVEIDEARVNYIFDPANREAVMARSVINDIVQQAVGRTDPVMSVDEAVSIPGTRYIEFLVPGLIALSIMTSSLFGTAMTIVANRRENLLKRYLATPMKPWEYIISHIIGRGFILAVELGAILIAAKLMFNVSMGSQLLDLIAVAIIGTAAFTALAILCGARTANAATLNGMTNLISLPMMMVAGVWFSRSNFPEWIAEPARYLPLTALVDGLRIVALEGRPFFSATHEMIVLSVYFAVCTIASVKLFKWY